MTARRGLRHAAFFEALATQDRAGPFWRATSAGLVTLRLVDRFMRLREDGRTVPVEAVRAVRRAVNRVNRGSALRAPLDALSCAVSAALYNDGPSTTSCRVVPVGVVPRCLSHVHRVRHDAGRR